MDVGVFLFFFDICFGEGFKEGSGSWGDFILGIRNGGGELGREVKMLGVFWFEVSRVGG